MSKSRKVSFQDIKSEVIKRIQNRVWRQGTLLPTEHELALEFDCARATVNRALRELAEEGIVDRKRKSGTRVNMSPIKQAKFEISIVRQTIEDTNAIYRYSLVDRALAQAPDWLRAQLNVPVDGQVLYVKCMHYADDHPFQIEERWINVDAVPDVVDADFTQSGPNEWLLAEVPFSNAEITFCAVAATEAMAEFLAAPLNAPLFQMERKTWFRGKPVTFVRMSFRPGYRMSTKY